MFLSLYIIFSHGILLIFGQSSNFSCNSGNMCQSQTYSCLQNADCYIDCNGATVCQLSTFNCPDNYNCYIKGRGGGQDAMRGTTINGGNNGNLIHECGANSLSYACYQQVIWCPVGGVCNITSNGTSAYWNAQIRGDDAIQLNVYSSTSRPYGLAASNIYCPTSDSAECNIFVEGGENYMLSSTDIYSVKSFLDLSITCIYQTSVTDECFASGQSPIMHCTGDYSETCEMELDSGYNNWSCTTASVCDSFTAQPTNVPTTAQPTNIPTTAQPTYSPTVIPTTNNPTTGAPTTAQPTNVPTTPTNNPTTGAPTTNNPTSNNPTTYSPTTNTGTSIPTDNPVTSNSSSFPTNNPSNSNPTSSPMTDSSNGSTTGSIYFVLMVFIVYFV